MIIKSKGNPLPNHSLIFSLKLCTEEDSSLITLVAGLDKNGKGVVFGYDAIGSYGSDKALAQGSGAHMILPFLDA